MAKFLFKRALALIAILFVVSIGTFFLIHLLPGDPTVTILGPNDTAHNKAVLLQQLGLNKPIWQQYWIWLGNVLTGNLGQSFITHATVTSTLAHAVPIDIELVIISQVLALGIAIPLAIASARRPNGLLDRVSTTSSFAMLACSWC